MLKHWLWLTCRPGIGTRGRAALLRIFGTAERIYALTEAECRSTEGFDKRWLEGVLDKSTEEAERILLACDNLGIGVLTYADEAYPDRLRNIPDPPAVLYYRGTLPDFDHEAAVAVVGTRHCTAYGLLHAKQFSKLMAASGAIVVSGGARGIDTMALRAALDSAMPVVCVLGCGADVAYPPENRFLFREITAHGCLISEYPPGTRPDRGNFPVRNRIISGLSLGVLVIEAPERSGALITATHALEQGRDVFTIPGNIGAKNCEGTNRLLREGASLVMDGWDVVSSYVYLFPDKLTDGRTRSAMEHVYQMRYKKALPVYTPKCISDGDDKKAVDIPASNAYSDEKEHAPLTPDEQKVKALLGVEPTHSDELIARSGLPAQRVLAALTLLQLHKCAEKLPGNFYRGI